MSNSFAVEVERLGKTYRDGLFGYKRFEALKDVSLQVKSGEVFGLLGPNGAGKTTLLKILLGIIRKTTGTATLLGMPAGSLGVRAHVGYLPENLKMPGHHTMLTALDLFGSLSNLSGSTIRERRDELIEMVGLKGREKDRIKKFSKGMLQRLGLAQALLVRPKMLILDEPTDGLDPRARAEMRTLILKLKGEGITVFVNSHILQEVELVCDRVAILDKGSLKFCGAVSETSDVVRQQSAMLQVDMVVSGSRTNISHALTGTEIVASHELPDGNLDVELKLSGQTAVDQLIDRMRASEVSLISLKRKRASLEEAFLAILDNSQSAPSAQANND